MAAERVMLKKKDEVYCFEGNGKVTYGRIFDVDSKGIIKKKFDAKLK